MTEQNNDNKKLKYEIVSMDKLIDSSEGYQFLIKKMLPYIRLSNSGILNLVVNYDCPKLTDTLLSKAFKLKNLYKGTSSIDARELEMGKPGEGVARAYIDELLYGSIEFEENDSGLFMPVIDNRTGARKRKNDGFISRPESKMKTNEDFLLVIKNIDTSPDFCPEKVGEIGPKASYIFTKFRNASIRGYGKLLLVSNEPIKLAFPITTLYMPYVSEFEASSILNAHLFLYESHGYDILMSDQQKTGLVRKLTGLTYSSAENAVSQACPVSSSATDQTLDANKLLTHVRNNINRSFMEKGFGLTHLSSRPWEDYICPETSSFTHDVKKLMQDFDEIKELRTKQEEMVNLKEDTDDIDNLISSLENRIPKVIMLYGKGGVGKSAFPIHLAGLLNFDVWDFNIGATHSKWIGEGASQMRESLDAIMQTSNVVVRIDEYDRAIGSTSSSGEGMHEAHKQVESEFMNWLQNNQETNEFAKKNIIVVLTTNHKENITGPLLRSGRVDLVISIDNFDSSSMKKTLETCARRMYNRGVKAIGYKKAEDLQKKIDSMDINEASEFLTENGFTVRDLEQLILEMARHDYYHKIGKEGIEWSSDNFINVIKMSQGCISGDGDLTKELELGDRYLLNNQKKEESEDKQLLFDLNEEIEKKDTKNEVLKKI